MSNRTNVEMECKATKYCTPRHVKRHKLLCRDNNGDLKEHAASQTLWCSLHVNQEPRNNRFRMTHSVFFKMSHDVSNHEMFKR